MVVREKARRDAAGPAPADESAWTFPRGTSDVWTPFGVRTAPPSATALKELREEMGLSEADLKAPLGGAAGGPVPGDEPLFLGEDYFEQETYSKTFEGRVVPTHNVLQRCYVRMIRPQAFRRLQQQGLRVGVDKEWGLFPVSSLDGPLRAGLEAYLARQRKFLEMEQLQLILGKPKQPGRTEERPAPRAPEPRRGPAPRTPERRGGAPDDRRRQPATADSPGSWRKEGGPRARAPPPPADDDGEWSTTPKRKGH
eukprot:GAFH01003796.1.p2 GENE.GAFH01003796.1~~GAFH01003796.1.p2  ORF type:complete len:254 (-),score=79.24 GAFH01003796.1:64-825(-)